MHKLDHEKLPLTRRDNHSPSHEMNYMTAILKLDKRKMRVTFITLSIALVATEGKLDRISSSNYRELTPEDIGAYHTDAFEILGEKYSKSKPSTHLDVMMDMSEILAGYCPLNDSTCVSSAYQTTMKHFDVTAKMTPRQIEYPTNLDAKIKQSVESIFSTVYTIDEHNLDQVLSSLKDIERDLKRMTNDTNDTNDVNKVHQIAGLTGVSIAIESTKLWHGTYHDENHPLHAMIGHFSKQQENEDTADRKLQLLQVPFCVANTITADITAGIQIIFKTDIDALLTEVPLTVFTKSLYDIIFFSIGASVAAFFGIEIPLPVPSTSPSPTALLIPAPSFAPSISHAPSTLIRPSSSPTTTFAPTTVEDGGGGLPQNPSLICVFYPQLCN